MKGRIWAAAILTVGVVVGAFYLNDLKTHAEDTTSLTPQQLEIKEKMQNAIDYYTHAKGSYYHKSSSGNVQFVASTFKKAVCPEVIL